MTQLEVVDDAVHGAVVRKHALRPAEQRRMDHERELLRAAQHPGVVELVGNDHDDELVTRFVGSESLETIGALDATRAAHIVAALADTLADLHALGIVHGRVEPGHVVLDDDDRPVLCGFGGATYVGTIAPPSAPLPPELTDPARGPQLPAEPSTDVFGVGAVLRLLLEDADVGSEPIPERRFTLERLRHPWSGYQRRALLNLADQASADDPAHRPTCRELAAAVRDALPGDSGGRDPMATLRPDVAVAVGAGRGRRAATLGAAAAGLALLFVGLSSLADGPAPSTSSASAVATTQPSSTTTADPATAPDERCAATFVPPAADVDGDGCADGTASVDGGVVVVGTVRYAVGDGDAVVVVADFDCDGLATVAVLRPSSGAVYEFTSWPSAGTDATAAHVGDAPGAVKLQASDDTCPSLQAVDADGTVEALT